MLIENDIKLDFDDVLIKPKRSYLSSRSEVELQKEYNFLCSGQTWQGIPIMAANMDHVGTWKMAESLSKHGLMTCIHKYVEQRDWRNYLEASLDPNYVILTTGINKEELHQCITTVKELGDLIKFVCIDVANGYQTSLVDAVKLLRDNLPKVTIIAGNVVTPEMTLELLTSGADIIKLGIGPGSVCTTRSKAGVGYPQLSAIVDCSDAAHGIGGHIISDGGCVRSGDVAKAFAAGSDFVMLGGMLAGHDQCGGSLIKDGELITGMQFYGMSSATAMDKHSGGVANYRAAEGKTVVVKYKGDVENTVQDLLGGIRSACTYVGASSLKKLPKCTTFIRVNRQKNDIFGKE